MTPHEEHFQRLLRLLDLEAAAEQQAFLAQRARDAADPERSGHTLVRLAIRAESAGLGGRILVTLGKRNQTQPLPWNLLDVGTPVLLSSEADPNIAQRGIVSQRNRDAIQVALVDWPDEEQLSWRLDAAHDEIARQRQRAALQQAQQADRGRLGRWRRVLLGELEPAWNREEPLIPFNEHLDNSQQAAVRFALTVEDVGIIHGPPGTGKTTAVVELIRQAVRRGQRVLACAPSNLGVDNLFERLLAAGEKVVRLGHPARVMPALRNHTLDLLAETHPDVHLAEKLRRDAHVLFRQADRHTRVRPAPGAKQAARQEARDMLREARQLENAAVAHILDSMDIICATLTGLDDSLLGRRHFDLGVIDEASQATEAASWLPTLWCDRLVLAGDPCQLPPTVISPEATRQGLGISLMERLMMRHATQHTPLLSRQLTVQYRMHQTIMDFASAEFYAGTLTAHPSVASHLLAGMPQVTSLDLTRTPLTFIDTAGANYDELAEPDGDSRLNPQEAELVCRQVASLIDARVSPADIGIITPYSAQVRLLLEMLPLPELEINSVDGFQGREKEVIIVSLVRANVHGDIGFLADVRRMNVALTRARRKLILIGDSATIGHHPFYQRLLTYLEQVGAYRSVWEEAGGY